MRIIFASDNNYASYLTVAIYSLLRYNPFPLEIAILDLGIGNSNRILLQKIVTKANSVISFIPVDADEFIHMPLTIKHISLASYARLKAAEYLPEWDKAIYLDVDILVTDSLQELWGIDLGKNWLAACLDPFIEWHQPPYKPKIGLSEQVHYFNAGVLLLNLDQWRQHDIFLQSLKWLTQYKSVIQYQDQDVLNGVCQGKVQFVNSRFNFMPMVKTRLRRSKKYRSVVLNPLEKVTMPIAVVHYCGSQKAWHSDCMHNYAERFALYWKDICSSYPSELEGDFSVDQLRQCKRSFRTLFDRLLYQIY